MNQEFDEVVKDSMTWFTDGVDVPAGLAAQAREHVRRQRRARMGWVATGTAVVAAAAVVAGAAGAGSVPQHAVAKSGTAKSRTARGASRAVLTTAMVVGRVDRALAKTAVSNPVAYTRQMFQGGQVFLMIPHVGPAEVHSNISETWSRGAVSNTEYVTAAGSPLFAQHTDNSSGKSVQTMISYPKRVWWAGTYDAPAATRPKLACTLAETDLTAAQWTREVRKLLSCGAAVAGYQQVDGVRAVKLKLSSTIKRACAASNYQSKCTPVPVGWSGVVWADASTYLPVRMVAHGHHFGFQIDFRWLAPTAANLTKLHQTVPAGFRHV